jgi:L-2-hydroxyglutarate oxidase LhgO
MRALQGDLEDRGGAIAFNTKVERLIHTQAGWVVRYSGTECGELAVDAVVNSAGLGAQMLARRTDDYPEQRVPRLVMARGNYYGYTGRPVFSRLIYPAPRIDGGLGTHVTLDLAGRMRLDPTSSGSTRRITTSIRSGRSRSTPASAVIGRACRTIHCSPTAGIRPKLTGPGEAAADLDRRSAQHGLPGLVQLFGIESPGLTSSLSIAEDVVGYLKS